jgi:hypothetical protein
MRRATIASLVVILAGACIALAACTPAQIYRWCTANPQYHYNCSTVTTSTTMPSTTTTTVAHGACTTDGSWGSVSWPNANNDQGIDDPQRTSNYPGLPLSNGYNDELNVDIFSPSTNSTISGSGCPQAFTVNANEINYQDCGYCVQAYPDIRLTWGQSPGNQPISNFSHINATYSVNDPVPTSDTKDVYNDAFDLWPANNGGYTGSTDAMIWVNNHNVGSGGATKIGTTTIEGHAITVYNCCNNTPPTSGNPEIILSFDTPDLHDTLDLVPFANYLVSIGAWSSNAAWSSIQFGTEDREVTGPFTYGLSLATTPATG